MFAGGPDVAAAADEGAETGGFADADAPAPADGDSAPVGTEGVAAGVPEPGDGAPAEANMGDATGPVTIDGGGITPTPSKEAGDVGGVTGAFVGVEFASAATATRRGNIANQTTAAATLARRVRQCL